MLYACNVWYNDIYAMKVWELSLLNTGWPNTYDARSAHAGSIQRVCWAPTSSLSLQPLHFKAACREMQAAWNTVFFPDKYCLIKEVNDDNISKLRPGFVFEWVLIFYLFIFFFYISLENIQKCLINWLPQNLLDSFVSWAGLSWEHCTNEHFLSAVSGRVWPAAGSR